MTVLPELEEQLVRAAGGRAADLPSQGRGPARAWAGGLALAAGVAAALAVALLGVALLGHARQAGEQTAGKQSESGSQLRKLVAEFAVLRRAQTPADAPPKDWQAVAVPSAARLLPGLTRLATTLHDGERVFVGVEQSSIARGSHHSSSCVLGIFITGPKSYAGSASFDPKTGYAPFPSPLGMRRDQRTRAWVPTWVSIVPDGVTSVAWTFFAPSEGGNKRRVVAIKVPVAGNVAGASVAGTSPADLVRVAWKGAGGRTIRTYTHPGASHATPLQGAVRDVLGSDGIGAVKFGASPAAMRAAIGSLLGQPGGAYKRGGSCDLDHDIQWSDDRTANGPPLMIAYFRRSKFTGYQYGEYGTLTAPRLPARDHALATRRGLGIGDTLARGRQLYGRALTISPAQGGTWGVRTAGGRIDGYAWGAPKDGAVSPQSVVATIDAGDVGCPAVSP